MGTEDKTLRQFIEQFQIGEVKDVVTDENRANFGHTEESAMGMEILQYTLDFRKVFEMGELPSIATSYLLRLGYGKVIAEGKCCRNPPPIHKYEAVMTFTHIYEVIAEDEERGRILISVAINETHCLFSKHTSIV